MAMTLFPTSFVLQTNSRSQFLCVLETPPANRPSGFMNFLESNIWNPRVKFVTEHSQTGDGTLVHIRSCSNNKYWVVQEIEGRQWIVASSDKPEEDQTNPSCTLFRPSFHTSSGFPGFQLLSISRSLSVVHINGSITGGLSLSRVAQSFHTRDWSSLVVLPTHVSFKSEELDGNYLCSRVIETFPYHRFESGLDVGDPLVAHELIPVADGSYRIKNTHFGKRWRRSPNWIWADAEDNNFTMDTSFEFIKISDNVIAVRNMGNNRFCGGLTTEGKTNCLNAQYTSISRQTRLIVEERVLERTISEVRYRLSDSRIYNEVIEEASHAFATNDSVDKDSTITLSYSSTDSRTTYFNNSVSVSLGVKVEFKTTVIPFIAEAKVETTLSTGYAYEWGVQKTTERKREAGYAVVVPPLTTMKVALMYTKAACDVPFSYRQTDLLTTGERVVTLKDDGLYTGINSYNYYFQSTKLDFDDQGRVYV